MRLLYLLPTLYVFALCYIVQTRSQDYKAPTPDPKRPLDRLPDARPPLERRKFVSALVEKEIEAVAKQIRDPALQRIWRNAYPNTLDTTVAWYNLDFDKPLEIAMPLSVLITGDITASWLRDSASQINPYLHLLQRNGNHTSEWDKLYRLALGLVYIQSKYIVHYPYANSFGPPSMARIKHPKNGAMNQSRSDADWIFPPPDMERSAYAPEPANKSAYYPGLDTSGVYVFEAKYEVDSLANFVRLCVQLARMSGRMDFVDKPIWREALGMVLSLVKAQQRSTDEEREALDYALKHQPTPDHADKKKPPIVAHKMPTTSAHHKSTTHRPRPRPLSTSMWEPLPSLQRQRIEPEPRKHDPASKRGETVSLSPEWDRRFAPLGGFYRFQRELYRSASETRTENGFGQPAARTGMVKSAFRPSDDATVLPFFVPGNAMLATALDDMGKLLASITKPDARLSLLRDTCLSVGQEIIEGIKKHAIVNRDDAGGSVLVYETDGYGSQYFMDDANVPSLLSLPYLGFIDAEDPLYVRTRKMVLSKETNQYYFSGPQGEGVGGPHVGYGMAWPMSRSMQILTTKSKEEQRNALAYLRSTTSGTGLIHESVSVTDRSIFTRDWFAWTNGLFGEAILHVMKTNPTLLTDEDYDR